jgi:hypothetical protein
MCTQVSDDGLHALAGLTTLTHLGRRWVWCAHACGVDGIPGDSAAANVRSSTRMGQGGRLVHGTIGAALAARQETRRAGYGDLGQHRLLVRVHRG